MANDFGASFAKVARRFPQKLDVFCRGVIVGIGSKLVERSPVDTGRFKGNWVPVIGSSHDTTTDQAAEDKDGSGSLARINQAAGDFKAGQRMFITNSLPYAKPLEYGHSQQAPAGMVRITVQEAAQEMRDLVEQTKDM